MSARHALGALLRAAVLMAPPVTLATVLYAAPKAAPSAKPAAAKPPAKPPAPKPKPSAVGDAATDAPADAKAPKEATPIKGDGGGASGPELVKESEKKEGDASVKVFEFGTTEIEGRSRWPAISYFTRRMRAEFEAQKLPHRPFLPELGATKADPAVK